MAFTITPLAGIDLVDIQTVAEQATNGGTRFQSDSWYRLSGYICPGREIQIAENNVIHRE